MTYLTYMTSIIKTTDLYILKQGFSGNLITTKIVLYVMRHLPAVFGIYLVSFLFIISWKPEPAQWLMEKHKGFTFYYTSIDKDNKAEYIDILENGIKQVNQFFSQDYISSFKVYSHPDRSSLDSTWQKDWNMPGFKSECWMVASGISTRVDMISPKYWDTQS